MRCAIAHVQGLLDLILEISIDLSSSAPVIPIQDPGLAILKQGPGSGKNSKNSPVEIAVKPLNSHGSMSDLVTAKLTGMANLSLVGRGERDVFSPLSGCPQPLSFESSLLLIETALEMLPSPSATELEESCGRDLGDEVPTGALSLSVPSVPTHLQSRALGDSISHPSPEQHAAVLYAAVPLSVRVGALGHACHQAAATAICALSTISHDSNLSVGPFSRTPSSVQSCLIKLLLAVFEAYKRTATIGVEDLFLAEAEDAAEALIRGEPSSKSVALPLSTSSATRRQGAERGAIELTGPRSHLSWRGQGSDSLSGPQALSSSGKVVLEGDEAARGRIGLSSAMPADTSAGNSNSTYIGCSKRSTSGSRIAGGTQDPPLRHRRSGQLEQSANVGIPMSCVKDKKISAPGWSDDSSEDSGAESIVEDDAQRNLSSGAMGHTRAKSSPAGILSQSVVHLSTAVQSCLDRYDLPCSALKDFQREYDTASSGDTLNSCDL